MRMWMVYPEILCRNHLLGEDLETHMIEGCIRKGKSLKGFVEKGLIETRSLRQRHDDLAEEITARGWNHQTPMLYEDELRWGEVDREASYGELVSRCPECWKRHKIIRKGGMK